MTREVEMKKVGLCLGVALVCIFAVGSVQAETPDTERRLRAIEEKLALGDKQDKKANYDTHGVQSTRAVKVSYGSIGLHPVIIMLAVLVGAEFFGILGIVLAVPATAALNVLFARGLAAYKKSKMYRGSPRGPA